MCPTDEFAFRETKDSYIRRALADLYNFLDGVESEEESPISYSQHETLEKVIKTLNLALTTPSNAQDSSADVSRPDKQ